MSGRKRSALSWLLTLVRYALCLGAILFLINAVHWYDRVRLEGPNGSVVRLLETRADGYVILRDGQPQHIPPDAVHHEVVGGQRVPEIHYGIRSIVMRLNWLLALLATAIFAPVWIIQSARLVLMMRIQGVALSLWNAIKLTYAGCFFNFALPGSTGGDLIKAYYVTLYTHSKKTEVVTTVFIDRAIGLLGLMVIAAIAIVIKWDPGQFGHLVTVLGFIALGLALGAVVVFSRRVRSVLHLADLAARLPGGQQLLRIGRATIALRQHKELVLASVLLTLVLQFFVLLSAAVMAWAIGMHGSLHYFMIYVAIGYLIAAIPINPPQAFGVMEGFYVLFFTATGQNTASQAVALALAVRLIQLVWALPGVLVPLFGAHLPSKRELEALEQVEAPSAAPQGASLAEALGRFPDASTATRK